MSKTKGQGHQRKNALSAAVRMACAGCKQRAAAADGTIASLPGVISGACVPCMFAKTSVVLVYLFI